MIKNENSTKDILLALRMKIFLVQLPFLEDLIDFNRDNQLEFD